MLEGEKEDQPTPDGIFRITTLNRDHAANHLETLRRVGLCGLLKKIERCFHFVSYSMGQKTFPGIWKVQILSPLPLHLNGSKKSTCQVQQSLFKEHRKTPS